MLALFALAAAAAATLASAQGTYQNFTTYLSGVRYHGGNFVENIDPPMWYEHLYYTPAWGIPRVGGPGLSGGTCDCDGLCAVEGLYVLNLNTTSPAADATIHASPRFTYGFDFFSAYLGCVVKTLQKNPNDGTVGYANEGIDCTITATGRKDHGPAVTQTFKFKAVTTADDGCPHQDPALFQFDAKLWRNVTHLSLNATAARSARVKWAPSIVLDKQSYGGVVAPAS